MLSDVQYKLIALMRNNFKENVQKLFYGTGTIDYLVIDSKTDTTQLIKIPTIRQLVVDNIGPADLITGTYVAGEPISMYSAVYFDVTTSKVYKADYRYKSKSEVLGIALADALTDEPVKITTAGTLENPNWNWSVGGALYLKTGGTYDQSFPEVGYYIVKIGTAVSPTAIDINIGDPILNQIGV